MTPAIDLSIKDRYPGLNSFRSDEKAIFYGRSRETTELFRMVRSEQMVTLFSKSGLGKSSLLSAGLFPQLTASGFYPIRIRLQQEKTNPYGPVCKSPVEIVTDEYREQVNKVYEKAELTQPAAAYSTAGDRLWERIKAHPFPAGTVPVLVFDQFEEFFGYTLTEQKDFASQLAELMHDQAPTRCINWLLDLPAAEQTPEAIAWSQQPVMKCIFAIRSDRLAEMHSLKPYIPLILRNRYELGPLTKQQAKEAIEEPAKQAQPEGPFATSDFGYDQNVMNDILAALTEKKESGMGEDRDEVEGSQLQIVCQYVESRQKEEFTKQVDRSVIGGKDQIKRILIKFYRAQLAKAGDAADQAAAANVLENELIEGGRRVGLSELRMMRLLGSFDDVHKLEIIKQLQDARLIRSETTQLGKTYELSHDTLIEAIEKSRKIRLAWQQRRISREDAIRRNKELQAERERRDTELREQAEQLRKETEEKEKATRLKDKLVRLTFGLVLLSVIMVFMAVWAVNAKKDAEKSKQSAQKSQQQAFKMSAMYQHNFGRQYVAYALWRDIDSVENSQLTEKNQFAPYSGVIIQSDTNQHYVGSMYDDGTIEVRQQRDGKPDTIIYQKNAASFSLAGSILALYSANKTRDTMASPYYIQFYDLAAKKDLLPIPIPVTNLQAVTLSGDGQYATVLDSRRRPHLYRLTGESAQDLMTFGRMLTEDKAELYPSSFRMTVNRSSTYAIVMDESYRIWVYDLRQQSKLVGPVRTKAYRFSGDGSKLACIQKQSLLIYTLTDPAVRADTIPLSAFYKGRSILQLLFTPDNDKVSILTDDPKQLRVINLSGNQPVSTTSDLVNAELVGRSHALVRRAGNRIELMDITSGAIIQCPLPDMIGRPDMVFYSPDGRTDTHLIALYRDRVELIDLRTKQKHSILQNGKPFGRLSLTGNLLRIQLGERNQDNQATADYLAFFIDAAKNKPAYLRQFVYPTLNNAQREQYGLTTQ